MILISLVLTFSDSMISILLLSAQTRSNLSVDAEVDIAKLGFSSSFMTQNVYILLTTTYFTGNQVFSKQLQVLLRCSKQFWC